MVYTYEFVTSLWYKPENFPYYLFEYLPLNIKKKIKSEFYKKHSNYIPYKNIKQFPYFEFIRESLEYITGLGGSEYLIYLRNRLHDCYVSKILGESNCNIVIGYEMSSLRTFVKAKEKNIKTVLDLPQVHYKSIQSNSCNYQQTFNKRNRWVERINKTKEMEMQLADYIITLSDFAKQTLVDNGIGENKIFIANLGFDSEIFIKKDSYRDEGIFKILFVGSITKRKGVDLLLEAYYDLNLPESELILIGGMADASDLLKNFKGNYKYIPFTNQKELSNYYRDADIFVFPSYLDSWGMVVLESMACGTPAIVSENTGSRDAIDDGKDGFVIPAYNKEILKEKIKYFYNNRSAVERFGKRAEKKSSKYIWENYRKNIKSIINQILQ
jgi:glycosyltransferase involved in cell wall biosynthesis